MLYLTNFVILSTQKGNFILFNFFYLGFTPCKAEQPLQGMELQEKETQKDQGIQGFCLEKTYSYKISVNTRLKAI